MASVFRKIRILPFLCVLLACSSPSSALQSSSRFEDGELKGFTRSNIEHIIVTLADPIEVHRVQGIILDQNGEAIPEALFEIRDAKGQVRGGMADKNGRFKIPHVGEGTYYFKATKNDFQSVTGKIIVSNSTGARNKIKIVMPVGV